MQKQDGQRRIRIVSTGVYIPEKVLTNADLEKMVDTSDEWITSRSGIKERRMAREDQASSDLGIAAARQALERAGLTIKDIDVIVVAANTGDTTFPSTASWIHRGLGAAHIPAFDVGAGCTGMIYTLIVAEGLILSGAAKRALLIGTEILTKFTNWEDRGTCVLFGDGAGAFVVEESHDDSGMISHYWGADGSLADLLYIPAGGSRLPATEQTVADRLHFIRMKGNEVFKHAVRRMGEAALVALRRAGLHKEAVDYLIPHQANIRIIEATAERLKLPPEKVFINIQKYGNCSVATIPLALHELVEEKRLKKGDIILLDAFGAGFTWAAAVYRW